MFLLLARLVQVSYDITGQRHGCTSVTQSLRRCWIHFRCQSLFERQQVAGGCDFR